MPSTDQLLGIIKTDHGRTKKLVAGQTIYGQNGEDKRSAYLLPDTTPVGDFVPDPDGANVNGGYIARLAYQVRLNAEPSSYGPSRAAAWLSTVWDAPGTAPAAPASHYAYYFLASSDAGHATYMQGNACVVALAETRAGQTHGNSQAGIFVATHEDATAGGKLVAVQTVTKFKGTDIGWDASDDGDADGPDGDLSDSAAGTPTAAGYGVVINNAGPSSGMAAAFVRARSSGAGGSKWHHGYLLRADAVDAFAFRYKQHFAVQAHDFDPGTGAHAMTYVGIGTDLPDTPLHVQGPISLEARIETTQSVTGAYELGRLSYWGRSDFGTSTEEMARQLVQVTSPVHGAETSELRWSTRSNTLAERMRLGLGLYDPGATGGDKGIGSINFRAVYVNGVLALGVDLSAPATPTGLSNPPTQTLRTSTAGTQQVVVAWSWTANTETDLAGYVVALKRGSGGFQTFKVEDNGFECVANAGEALQLKLLAHDVQHNKSVYCSAVSYTVTGDATAPAGAVTVITAPQARPRGAFMRARQSDTNFGGFALYVSDNGGADTLVDFFPGRPGKTVPIQDVSAYTIGHTLAYKVAPVNQDLVESATKTSLGASITYAGVKSADVEANQILLGTHVANSAGSSVTDNDALNTKAHDIRGFNRQPTFQRWSGSIPDNFSAVGTATVTKQTTSPRYGEWSLEVAYPASDDQYHLSSTSEVRVPAAADDYYVVEYEVELVSGNFQRAGVWWRVNYQDTSNFKSFILDLGTEHGTTPTTGKIYAGAKVVSATLTGTPTGLPGSATMYLMGNHSLMGDSVSAKTLRWHRVLVRKATKQEIRAEKAIDDNGNVDFVKVNGSTKPSDNATVGALVGTNLKDSTGTITLGDTDVDNSKTVSIRSINKNDTFQNWPSTNPAGYAASGSPVVAKIISAPRYGRWMLQVSGTASPGADQYIVAAYSSGSVEMRLPNDLDYVTMEYDVNTDTDFKRCGAILRLTYQTSGDYKEFRLSMFDEQASPVSGQFYTHATTIAATTVGAPTGQPTDAALYVASNHASLSGGAYSAKAAQFARLHVRRASREEIKSAKAITAAGQIDMSSSAVINRLTTNLTDAKSCSRLDPSDLFDIISVNNTTTGNSSTLSSSTKSAINIRTVGFTYGVTLSTSGASAGDRREVSNGESSDSNVIVAASATVNLIPGTKGVFVYQTGGVNAFVLRETIVLADATTGQIHPNLLSNAQLRGRTRTTADVNNTPFVFGTDGPTIVHDGPITAARNLNAFQGTAAAGARMRFVRTALSTGAFNLNIRDNASSVTLKALAGPSTWCDIEWNGVGFELTAAGSL